MLDTDVNESSSSKDLRAKGRRGSVGAVQAPLQSPLAIMLDIWRMDVAAKHGGIFPHSVLSSQHMASLTACKPTSLNQV